MPALQSLMRCQKEDEETSFGQRLAAHPQGSRFDAGSVAEATPTHTAFDLLLRERDGAPPSSVVMVLARALQVSADELLGMKPPPKAAPVLVKKTRKHAASGSDSSSSRSCRKKISAP